MGLLSSLTWVDLALAFLLFSSLYICYLVLDRLWFSPIAHFPGPFLARITFWYEFYYNWIKVGSYYLEVNEMHKKYGPIVRVSPEELHINDALFYHQVFVSSVVRRTENYPRSVEGTGFEDMTAVSHTHEMHRAVRAPLDPFFSKAGISRVESRVMLRIEKLGNRLRMEAGTGTVVNLTSALSSLTTDIVSSMLFEQPSDFLDDPDFNQKWFETMKMGTLSQPLFANLPWMTRLFTSRLLRYLLSRTTNWRIWDDKAQRQIMSTKLRPSGEAKTREDTTVFDHLVHSELVESHFGSGGFSRLAQLLQQAGTHNVAQTLGTIIVSLLLDPLRLDKLRAELALYFVDLGNQTPKLRDLEKLPYLSGCFKEGLRMAMGSMNRSARISPDVALQFGDWLIPQGVPVSMSSCWMHHDHIIFPDPKTFIPERWFVNTEKLKIMNSYFVPFSRGSRSCLAQNLVIMQVYHTIAHLFRPGAPEFQLYETDTSDITAIHGLLFPLPKIESKGIQVKIY